VRKAIAREFGGLWTNAGQADELDRLARAIAAKGFWRDGWIAVRRHTRIHGDRRPPDVERLKALEENLRPKDLVEKVRGVVLGAGGGGLDLDDGGGRGR